MRRTLLNLATALSLLLCVAAGVLWVRSYSWKEGASYHARGASCSFYTRYGRLACTADFNDSGPRPADRPAFNVIHRRQSGRGQNLVDRPDHAFAGFGIKRHGWADLPKPTWVVLVPMWFITAVLAVPPALWVRRAQRRRSAARRARGLCPECGYDLRATPGRCPECGSASPVSGGE